MTDNNSIVLSWIALSWSARSDLALKLMDMGFHLDDSSMLGAPADVTFMDCGPSGVYVEIHLASGAWMMFAVPARVDAFTAAEALEIENAH